GQAGFRMPEPRAGANRTLGTGGQEGLANRSNSCAEARFAPLRASRWASSELKSWSRRTVSRRQLSRPLPLSPTGLRSTRSQRNNRRLESALCNQFRHRPVIADQVVRAAREVGVLCSGGVDAQTLIECGENVAEMNRPGARLFTPARRRTENLPAAHAA